MVDGGNPPAASPADRAKKGARSRAERGGQAPACPRCGLIMLRWTGLLAAGASACYRQGSWYCPTCGELPPGTRTDGSPRVGRRRAREVLSESYVQRTLADVAARAGFEVQSSSEFRRAVLCDPTDGGCGRRWRPSGGTTVTPGIADLLFAHERITKMFPGTWLHIECKGTDTPWTGGKLGRQHLLFLSGANKMCRHPSVGVQILLHWYLSFQPAADDGTARFLYAYLRDNPAPAVDEEGRPIASGGEVAQ